jgi:hypothetical protein
MEARLGEDVGLAELAALTGLSTHHFGQAFNASTSTPPHRYLIGESTAPRNCLSPAIDRSPRARSANLEELAFFRRSTASLFLWVAAVFAEAGAFAGVAALAEVAAHSEEWGCR